MIKYPNRIIKGNSIGVTATSTGITIDSYIKRLDNAYKNLEKLGYKCIETDNVRTNKKLVSSDAKMRASQFMELWKNKNVNMIAQVYGGEFLMEILPYIDKSIIKNNSPKWITGYSDSSLLNYFITTNFNIATATTCNIIHFGMKELHQSLLNQITILENCSESIQNSFELFEKEKYPKTERIYTTFNLTEKVVLKHLYNKDSDIIEGRIIGGCIDALMHLMGTPFDNTIDFCKQFDEGMIWYLENCELTLPTLYRVLWQMKYSGWFENSNGFIIGRTRANISVEDYEYLDVLHNVFDDMNVPVVYDADIGHVAPQWTIINGSFAKFEYNNGKAKLIQKME